MIKVKDYLKNNLSSQPISRIVSAKRILGKTYSAFRHPIIYGSELIRDLYDDYLVIKYEDLTAHPNEVIEIVSDSLSLSYLIKSINSNQYVPPWKVFV